MCFSANASFGVAVVLTVAGIASIRKVRHTSYVMFAAIPLLFGIQQILEGFIWMDKMKHQEIPGLAVYLFMIFAQVIWPTWAPVSIWVMEKDRKRKKLLGIISVIGICVSGTLAYYLFRYDVTAKMIQYHIQYEINFPDQFRVPLAIGYFISTIFAPFISSGKRMLGLGLLILLSFAITKFYFDDYLISVWCFLAAIMSGVVYLILKDHHAGYKHE